MNNNIKKARLLAGLTQEDLAVALGTNRRQIHKLETGASDFRASTLIQLSDALGVSVAYILGIGLEDPTALSKEEARLLEMYRALSNEDKTVIERVVQALSQVQD